MNILKKIRVSGEVFFEYAYLSYKFTFENGSQSVVSGEYMFLLPKGAAVSSVRFIDADGNIINTEIIKASHARGFGNSAALVLRKLDGELYTVSLGAIGKGISNILLRAYVKVERLAGECRLNIPLALCIDGTDAAGIDRMAEVSLVMHGMGRDIRYSSPTHRLDKIEISDEISISSGEIPADRDFCIRFCGAEKRNSAIAECDNLKGEMLCRLYPDAEFFGGAGRADRLLIIYDATGSLQNEAISAALYAACSLIEKFAGDYAVIAAGRETYDVTGGFRKYSPRDVIDIMNIINELPSVGGSVVGSFERAAEMTDGRTMTVFVSGPRLTEGDVAAAAAERYLAKSRMCLLSLGAYERSRTLDKIADICGGMREHIYGGDRADERAEKIMEGFKSICTRGEISVDAEGAEAFIADGGNTDEGVTVYASYIGDSCPRCFTLRNKTEVRRFFIDEIPVYKSFAPIQLAYADKVYSELEKRMGECPPEEISAIRAKMESLGTKYSMLNSETALTAIIGDSKKFPIRVVIPNSGSPSYEAFRKGGLSMREGDDTFSAEEKERIFTGCMEVILRSMRADGAICADGEIDELMRRKQSLVCLLAVAAADESGEYAAFTELGRRYVGEFSFAGLSFTKDRQAAKNMLKSCFGAEKFVPYEGTVGLLTAAKIVWRIHSL